MDGTVELSPLIEADGLRRDYGGSPVLDVARLEIQAGDILAVLGPNGAGKSTLFRLLMLVERPDAGTIRFRGRPLDRDARTTVPMAGVFQRPHLFAGSVRWNVEIGPRGRRLSRAERERRTADTLSLMGLNALADRDVRTLSGGEAQRVAVARALATEPELLLLDEPTANLDVSVKRAFRRDLEHAVRERRCAVVVITHDPADAFALADRIAVMEGGRIVQQGAPDDLVLNPATPFVAAFTGADLLLDGVVESAREGLVVVRTPGGARIHGVAADALIERADAHASYRPEDVTLVPAASAGASSAVNRYRVAVRSLTTTGALVRVALAGDLELIALVTRQSVTHLGLAPGVRLEAHIKATAVRVFRAG